VAQDVYPGLPREYTLILRPLQPQYAGFFDIYDQVAPDALVSDVWEHGRDIIFETQHVVYDLHAAQLGAPPSYLFLAPAPRTGVPFVRAPPRRTLAADLCSLGLVR
jgi:hypothetical protein